MPATPPPVAVCRWSRSRAASRVRVPGNFLVFRGHELVLTLLREGKELQFLAPPDDPRLSEYLAPLHVLLSRDFQPRTHVMVETINGLAASTSPYADAIAIAFHTFREGKKLRVTGALGPLRAGRLRESRGGGPRPTCGRVATQNTG